MRQGVFRKTRSGGAGPLPHHHGLDAGAVKPEKLLESLLVAIALMAKPLGADK